MNRFLITNDDGIHSEGIISLARAFEKIGEVIVVAPSSEMSAASHSLTLTRPLRIRTVQQNWYAVDGTPTDCIVLALNSILKDQQIPDLVISGINHGANLGDNVTYSGTVAGALEGSMYGIPSIAISLFGRENREFDPATEVALRLAEIILKSDLPKGTLLNVNVPAGPIQGMKVVHTGNKVAEANVIECMDPRGQKYFWIGEEGTQWNEEPGTDFEAITQGFVSITPLRNDLTDHAKLSALDKLISSTSEPISF